MTTATIVFVVCVGYVIYILLGYPVLLSIMAKRWPRPIQRDPAHTPSVSVLLPVRNGRRWVAAKLANVLGELDYPPARLEVIVISDGSDDGTDELVQTNADPRIRFERIAPGGKAAALNRGIGLAHGEILFLTDVRQPLDSQCLRNLTACFADPTVGAVSGELIILSGKTRAEEHVGLYWRYEKQIRKRLSSIGSVFGATGAVYAIRRDLVRALPTHTLDDDVYLPLCAFFSGRRVVFDDSAVAYDYPTTLASEYQRKVRTLAGIYQVVGLFPALLWPGTPGWFHFMSHKFGRLLLPWALVVAALVTCWLPDPIRTIALSAELLLAGTAWLDGLISEKTAIKRLTSIARTFLMLMWASAVAATILFRPASSFWKQTHASAEVSSANPAGSKS